jgi:hypothetical protein
LTGGTGDGDADRGFHRVLAWLETGPGLGQHTASMIGYEKAVGAPRAPPSGWVVGSFEFPPAGPAGGVMGQCGDEKENHQT